MSSRVFAGDGEESFPDFGKWLKPGDPAPAGAPKDDPRFVSPQSKAAKAAKEVGESLPDGDPTVPEPSGDGDTATNEEQ
jgi:hypothetical protein